MLNLRLYTRKLTIILFFLLIADFSVQTAWAEVPYVVHPAWSPNGSKIASVINKSIEITDATSGQVLQILQGHSDTISSIAWSTDSASLATSSYDQTVKIWDTNSGQLLKTLIGHNEPVVYVLWVGKEEILSWGSDTTSNLYAWDVLTGNIISKSNGGSVSAAALSPKTNYVALSVSLILYIMDVDTLQVIRSSPRIECCANQMDSISWSPDGSQIVTGSLNGLVTIWDAGTLKVIQQFKANSNYQADSRDVPNLALSWVRDTVFSANGKMVLGISGDGSLKEWDSNTGVLIQENQLPNLATAKFSPFGGRLASLDATFLHSSEGITNGSNSRKTKLTISVPFPSSESLQTITQSCGTQIDVQQSLTAQITANKLQAFTAQVSALTDAQIQPGCKADLLAVAGALMGKSQ